LGGAADVTIENCVVANAPRDGVLAEGTTNLLIRNSLIMNNQLSGGRGGGLAGSGANMRVISSTFIDNGRDKIGAHNIYLRHLHDAVISSNLLVGGSNLGFVLHGSSSNVVIANNMIKGNSNGIDVTGGYSEEELFDKIFIMNNIIEDNGFREGEQGYGMLLKSMTNSLVANNVVSGNRLGGMVFESNNAGDLPSSNVIIAHNTFSEPASSWGSRVAGAGMQEIAIVNNIFEHWGSNKVILDKNENVEKSSLIMDYNLYYMPNRADKNILRYNGELLDIAHLRAQFSKELVGHYGNPLFENVSFYVESGSPASGAGMKTQIKNDLDDLTRLSPPTIGAYKVK